MNHRIIDSRRSLYKMLYFLTIGFKKWEKEKIIPDEVYTGMKLMVYECAKNNKKPPANIQELAKILTLPSKQWGILDVERIFPPDASLLDKEYGVTIEAEDFLENIESTEEYEQSIMKQILITSRKKTLDSDYRSIRAFLSNPNHSVITYHKLYDFVYRNVKDAQFQNLVFSCYEEIVNITNYRKCPNCGWTLEWRKGNWRCNKEDVCHFVSDVQDVSSFEMTDEKLMRMTPGIQKYVLLPGMSEQNIAKKLRKKGYTVTMYPNIDEYDIRIELKNQVIMIDVKDYRNPWQLANYLNNLHQSKIDSNVLYVIPDYRVQMISQYQKKVKNYLRNELKKIIKIYSESEIIKLLEVEKNEEKIK